MSETERGFGRIPPSDDRHLQRYSLTPATMPTTPTPVVLGINWYEGFDRSHLTSVGTTFSFPPLANWGGIRGGHAICLKPPSVRDGDRWWAYYDQLNTSACVGFSSSRMMTLLNRARYEGSMLYLQAQLVDEWPGGEPSYYGTSVRAGMDVLRTVGPYDMKTLLPQRDAGISANRWATSVEDIAACLSPVDGGKRVLDAGYVTMLNSWGIYYPHYVRIPLTTLQRLVFQEDGDATVVTDR